MNHAPRPAHTLSVVLLCATGVFLIALEQQWAWGLLAATALSLALGTRQFAKDMALLCVSLALLGITRIDTDVAPEHMFAMGTTLLLAVLIPYVVSRWAYKDCLVRFPLHHGRRWLRTEILYIFVTAIVAYFLLPFYLRNSGAYLNWEVQLEAGFLTRLFIGTNGLGIWDELFFISTILGILRRFLPFSWANVAQSILFTSFLYELGFTGWGPLMIFPFALIQGEVFRRTESLLYVITIHLTLDLVLYLALIHARYPEWMPIFLT
jgi:membrane protease YdiL (CAAX protease family)